MFTLCEENLVSHTGIVENAKLPVLLPREQVTAKSFHLVHKIGLELCQCSDLQVSGFPCLSKSATPFSY